MWRANWGREASSPWPSPPHSGGAARAAGQIRRHAQSLHASAGRACGAGWRGVGMRSRSLGPHCQKLGNKWRGDVACALMRAASPLVAVPVGEPLNLRVFTEHPDESGCGAHECARHELPSRPCARDSFTASNRDFYQRNGRSPPDGAKTTGTDGTVRPA